jgi:hypothetical protein
MARDITRGKVSMQPNHRFMRTHRTLTSHHYGEDCRLALRSSRGGILREPGLNGEHDRSPMIAQPRSLVSRYNTYHPMYLFLVNIAAIGSVLLRVLLMSAPSSFAIGSTYGITTQSVSSLRIWKISSGFETY